MKPLEKLYKSLSQRPRPEDVIEMIFPVLGAQLSSREMTVLQNAAGRSLNRHYYGYSSMASEFAAPVGAESQVQKAIEIFGLSRSLQVDTNDAESIQNFVDSTSLLIQKNSGENNFLVNRLSRHDRKACGLDLSKRQYNKRWRLLKRIEKKAQKLLEEQQKSAFAQTAKNGLARDISQSDFFANYNSACFIAYYTAQLNTRSEFTISGQKKPFDTISKLLFDRCLNAHTSRRVSIYEDKVNWWAIAHVYPSQEVLSRLTDRQKGALLGKWTSLLEEIALKLKQLWKENDINRKTMVVQQGNDSSTWNATAGAWNKARDHWMQLIYALGIEDILEDLCFGKVLRLMAADVVAWHHITGGKLDPNTKVWNTLPLPWNVFGDRETCTKNMVEVACAKAGLDPKKSGWIAPKTHGVVPFSPTPELVHGVAVSNPFLASILKKEKYYSGKKKSSKFGGFSSFWN